LNDITLVVLCAGNSTRFDNLCKKQWIRIDNEPLWLNVTNRLTSFSNFSKTIVVSHKDELSYMKNFSDDFIYVEGGDTRQNSIKNALEFVDTPYVMISDVARACISKNIISDLIQNKNKASCIVPILDVSDTVIFEKNTINREDVKLIQTPQLSNSDILRKAISKDIEFTDESSAIKNIGEGIFYIKGDIASKKLTFFEDIFIRENISFTQAVDKAIEHVKDNFCGIEIDMDTIQNIPSSAKTSSGISTIQARQYINRVASKLNACYLHIAEAAPVLSHIKTDNKTGKLIGYLIADYIKARNTFKSQKN